MNYNITVFRSEKRILENPFAKKKADKKVEKTLLTPVIAINVITDAAVTASELKAKISEEVDKYIKFEILETSLEEKGTKKAYIDDDLVEARDLIYTASIKR